MGGDGRGRHHGIDPHLFIGILIAALLLMIFVPETVLRLPRQFGYEG